MNHAQSDSAMENNERKGTRNKMVSVQISSVNGHLHLGHAGSLASFEFKKFYSIVFVQLQGESTLHIYLKRLSEKKLSR